MAAIRKLVILCAGHGGGDPGATGQGTTEAHEVADIVNKTADILRRDGQVEVIHVPNELNFEAGINWVNTRHKGMNDGLSIEVHKNSAGSPAHGVETWYYGGDSDSEALANKVQEKLKSVLPDRGVKPDTTNRWGQLGWIRNVNTWSLLVEMGFVSNGGDPVGGEANGRYAKALAEGILNVWGLKLRGGSAMDEEDARHLYNVSIHRDSEDEQGWRGWIGKKFSDWAVTQYKPKSEWHAQNGIIVELRKRGIHNFTQLEPLLKAAEGKVVDKQAVITYLDKNLR